MSDITNEQLTEWERLIYKDKCLAAFLPKTMLALIAEVRRLRGMILDPETYLREKGWTPNECQHAWFPPWNAGQYIGDHINEAIANQLKHEMESEVRRLRKAVDYARAREARSEELERQNTWLRTALRDCGKEELALRVRKLEAARHD